MRERRGNDPGLRREAELRARLDALLAELRAGPPSYLARFVASLAGRLRVIPVEDVIWIEAADNYVHVHTAAGSALVRETMKTLEARLDPARFVARPPLGHRRDRARARAAGRSTPATTRSCSTAGTRRP